MQRAVACSENVGQPTLPGLTHETQTLATLIASEQSDRLQATGGGRNSLTFNPPHFRVGTFYPALGTHVTVLHGSAAVAGEGPIAAG